MAEFQRGELRGLITTDIMARGLDISDISHVVNFEMPETPESYIHRIGRTGRADANGTAISLVTPREAEMKIETEILMNREIDVLAFPEGVAVSAQLIGPEKEKEKAKQLLKKPKIAGAAFHEKAAKNKKINLGGPGKTKKKTGSVNRGLLKQQAAKKKKK
jgi:ATP-dependent RNA helicase RhlE